jgi:exopolysaccharide biosynthesis polyprenyl glycosylphosphotransferase
MVRRFSHNFALFAMALDAALVAAALALAALARPALSALPFARPLSGSAAELAPWPLFPLFALVWVAVLLQFGLYDGRRYLQPVDEFAGLTLATLLAGVASAGLLYLSFRDVSRLLFLVFGALAFGLLVGWRLLHRAWAARGGGAAAPRCVVALGAGEVAQDLRRKIQGHAQFGLRFAGFLADEPGEGVLGPLADTRRIVLEQGAEDVIIALPREAVEQANRAVAVLHDLPVRVWVIPDYFALALHRATVEDYAGIPMLDLRAPALDEQQRLAKRAFDLAFSLALLPAALPLMALIAALVWLSDRGPVFYSPERVGENGRLFSMLKFRTMSPDAEARLAEVGLAGPGGEFLFKTPDDPRVTRLGRFLRRTSLDELPQILNILKGDMSWVGPRPEQPFLVERYELWQRKRFAVPQGLTGWWQVNGRSDKPMHLNTEYDLYYVQNYSLGLDILILLRTAWAVLRGKGAY